MRAVEHEPFRYRIVVEWSEEDEVYVARVPAFEGVAAHGVAIANAVDEVVEATRAVIEAMKENGREVPTPEGPWPDGSQVVITEPHGFPYRMALSDARKKEEEVCECGR